MSRPEAVPAPDRPGTMTASVRAPPPFAQAEPHALQPTQTSLPSSTSNGVYPMRPRANTALNGRGGEPRSSRRALRVGIDVIRCFHLALIARCAGAVRQDRGRVSGWDPATAYVARLLALPGCSTIPNH